MPHYRRLNNANAVKRMTDFLGHSDIFVISLSLSLSLSQAQTASPPLFIYAHTCAKIYGFLCRNAKESLLFFSRN